MAELLIAAGAKLDALNGAKQTPLDVAKLNREVGGGLSQGSIGRLLIHVYSC